MKEQDDIEIRSEEVQEILGTPPNWMARYGTLLALMVVVIMGYLAYFIEYPEMVEAGITVTTTDPPKRLVTNMRGRIEKLLVRNEQAVSKGQVILTFESNARMSDILALDARLANMRTPTEEMLLQFRMPDSLLLGELKETMFNFYQKQEDLRTLVDNSYDNYSVKQLRRRIDQIQEGIRSDRNKWLNLSKEIDVLKSDLRSKESLLSDQLIAEKELRKLRNGLLSLTRIRESTEASIRSGEQEVNRLRAEITGVRANSEGTRQLAATDLREAFLDLQKAVDTWLDRYVITSPINGQVSLYMDRINEQQFIEEDKEIGVVVPPADKGSTEGTIWLKLPKSRPVKVGQKVLVRFPSYLDEDSGIIYGYVEEKGQVPINGQISIKVAFPKGLQTNRGTSIVEIQQMKGEASIIVEQKRFVQRIMEPLRSYN